MSMYGAMASGVPVPPPPPSVGVGLGVGLQVGVGVGEPPPEPVEQEAPLMVHPVGASEPPFTMKPKVTLAPGATVPL